LVYSHFVYRWKFWYLGWCCNITYCNHLVRPFVHKILLSHFPLLLLVQMIGYLVCDFELKL
jgi:hypothetical protein